MTVFEPETGEASPRILRHLAAAHAVTLVAGS